MEGNILSAIGVFSIMVPFMVLSSMKIRNWLNNKNTWIMIFIGFFGLAILGNLVPLFMKDYTDSLIVRMLNVPIYTICIYKLLHVGFLKIFRREPIDTFLNFKDDIFWDSLFNFILIVTTVLLPMILLALCLINTDGFKEYIQDEGYVKSSSMLSPQDKQA